MFFIQSISKFLVLLHEHMMPKHLIRKEFLPTNFTSRCICLGCLYRLPPAPTSSGPILPYLFCPPHPPPAPPEPTGRPFPSCTHCKVRIKIKTSHKLCLTFCRVSLTEGKTFLLLLLGWFGLLPDGRGLCGEEIIITVKTHFELTIAIVIWNYYMRYCALIF